MVAGLLLMPEQNKSHWTWCQQTLLFWLIVKFKDLHWKSNSTLFAACRQDRGCFKKKKEVKNTLKNGCVKKLGSFGNDSTKFQSNINSNLFLRDSLTRCGIKKKCGLIELCDYDGLGYNVFEWIQMPRGLVFSNKASPSLRNWTCQILGVVDPPTLNRDLFRTAILTPPRSDWPTMPTN